MTFASTSFSPNIHEPTISTSHGILAHPPVEDTEPDFFGQLSSLDSELINAIVQATRDFVPISNEWSPPGPPVTHLMVTAPLPPGFGWDPLRSFVETIVKTSEITAATMVFALVLLSRLATQNKPIVIDMHYPQHRVLCSALRIAARRFTFGSDRLIPHTEALFGKNSMKAMDQKFLKWLTLDTHVSNDELIARAASLIQYQCIQPSLRGNSKTQNSSSDPKQDFYRRFPRASNSAR